MLRLAALPVLEAFATALILAVLFNRDVFVYLSLPLNTSEVLCIMGNSPNQAIC